VAPWATVVCSIRNSAAIGGSTILDPMRALSFTANLFGAAALAFAIPLAILAVGVPIAIVVTLLLGFLGWQ
jgi:hypothetical protein